MHKNIEISLVDASFDFSLGDEYVIISFLLLKCANHTEAKIFNVFSSHS